MKTKRNETMADIRGYIRHPFTFLGGYTKILWMIDCEPVCPECAKRHYRNISDSTRNKDGSEWNALKVDIYLEGEVVECAYCSNLIEPDYGNPYKDNEE